MKMQLTIYIVSDRYYTISFSGWYVFIEASYPRLPNDKAILKLPDIYKTGPRCELRFWYHMLGSGIGSLSVTAKDHAGTVIDSWSKYGEQSAQWVQGGLFIPHADGLTITFEALRGDNYQGDIALDDIEFTNCDMNCKYLITPSPLFSKHFALSFVPILYSSLSLFSVSHYLFYFLP